jgi:hypothetical protein
MAIIYLKLIYLVCVNMEGTNSLTVYQDDFLFCSKLKNVVVKMFDCVRQWKIRRIYTYLIVMNDEILAEYKNLILMKGKKKNFGHSLEVLTV